MSGLLLYGNNKIIPFDPQFSLNSAAAKDGFDEQFARRLIQAGIKPGSLVHLETHAPCYCNTLSHIHQQVLVQLLEKNHYQLVKLNIHEVPDLMPWVPSFPALAVLDMEGKLRYLGPYATGIGCFTGDDLVNDIADIVKQPAPLGAIINSEAQGCYCPS
ncbi:DUF6436 domain-containing protein [Alteromonas sp. C1M14]|uniref:DUF6436 domain-containing protein n=1 Tax=Alteromonas sp. C1M14 TaxID=2841567 RepID=UPI001C093392|nr:DUF6436 domain-containing protein [Alteromonas sp. C1M14]MBU2980058.1 thioredoxin [Alteromonas sp. C1M14]